MSTRFPKVLFSVCAAFLFTAAAATAGDHLACYKVKDTLPKQKFPNVTLTSNTGDVSSQVGCTIATGAKLCCDAVDKIGVPQQPGGSTDPGPGISQFCCYKVKCPKGATGSLTIQDQFGTRTLPVAKPPTMVCAPEVMVTTTTTTTTTLPPTCSIEGATCGSCGTGICVRHCPGTALVCLNPGGFPVVCTSDAGCAVGEVCGGPPGFNCAVGQCAPGCP